MNHKAAAKCSNGHTFEWGKCKAEIKGFFGGTKECGSKLFEQIYDDGSTLTVSFDNREWNAVRCVRCRAVYRTAKCPQCGEDVPVSAFEKKGLWAKLG